jgi:hypothetical protein
LDRTDMNTDKNQSSLVITLHLFFHLVALL